jgi:HPt (histidine-containing phosphotransfer) domain-containing protein
MDDHPGMTTASLTQPPFDPEALERILDLGGDALRVALCEQLIADFLRLRDAIADDDRVRLARAAHELKGLAATIGAGTVSDMARNLDTTAQGLPAAASAGMIAPLQAQVDDIVSTLRSALRGNAGA